MENSLLKKPRGRPLTLDIDEAVSLYKKGVSCAKLSKMYGLTRQTMSHDLAKRIKEIKSVEKYKTNRAFILAEIQTKLLSGVTAEKIEKASLKDLFWCYGVIFDKERLETGKSTQNIANAYSNLVTQVHKERMKEVEVKIIKEPEGTTDKAKAGENPGGKRVVDQPSEKVKDEK